MKTTLAVLAVILCSFAAFGQSAQYRPTPFANGFVQTINSQSAAQTYFGMPATTNIALLNGTNTFTGTNRFSGPATITNSANSISAASYGSAQQTAAYTGGTNVVIDASKTLTFVTLTNTTHLSVTNLTVGASFTVLLLQDSTGTRAVTFDTTRWKFPSGSVPSVTTNANACDVLSSVADPFGTNAFTIHNARFQ